MAELKSLSLENLLSTLGEVTAAFDGLSMVVGLLRDGDVSRTTAEDFSHVSACSTASNTRSGFERTV